MRINQKMLVFSLSMALGTFHSKPTKNRELFKKAWDISS